MRLNVSRPRSQRWVAPDKLRLSVRNRESDDRAVQRLHRRRVLLETRPVTPFSIKASSPPPQLLPPSLLPHLWLCTRKQRKIRLLCLHAQMLRLINAVALLETVFFFYLYISGSFEISPLPNYAQQEISNHNLSSSKGYNYFMIYPTLAFLSLFFWKNETLSTFTFIY